MFILTQKNFQITKICRCTETEIISINFFFFRSTIDDVTGIIICDNQGLCLGGNKYNQFIFFFIFLFITFVHVLLLLLLFFFFTVRGKASEKNAGLISALAKQVTKFEPDSEPPVLTLENDSR